MRLPGMMLALSIVVVGCGDDAPIPYEAPKDGSIDGMTASTDSGIHLSDAHAADGGPIYVDADGNFVTIGLDGAILPPDGATGDAGADAAPVVACTGAFELVSATGAAPLFEAVRCSPTGASGLMYDWGEGAGFEASATHRYTKAGTYTVTQKTAAGMSTAQVTVTTFTPVKFSTTDHTVFNMDYTDYGPTALVTISGDGYVLEQANGIHDVYSAAARSDGSISAGSGVFYFEGHRLTDLPWYRGLLGITTKAFSDPAGLAKKYAFGGSNPLNAGVAAYDMGEGAGVNEGGACTGGPLDVNQLDTGYVVDYSGSAPTLYILQVVAGTPSVVTCPLAVSGPVFIYFAGERARVGPELVINTGQDTTNVPFVYGADAVRGALSAAGAPAGVVSALVMGFGVTNPARLDSKPTLTVPADMSVALNTPVTLPGSASDVEDGDLSAQISWVDTSLIYANQMPTVGASFSFTPNKLGLHPIVVKVKDLDGVTTTKTVNVTVTGALPQANPVQFVATDDTMRNNIYVSPDGLSVGFRTNQKDGIHANQGLIGGFQYFEVHRNNPTRNMAMGLVVEDGQLLDYDFDPVPWSCSMNIYQNGGAYINLILQPHHEWGSSDPSMDTSDYGIAVDFRGLYPLFHFIVAGKYVTTLKLTQTFAPVFPMLYGNGPASPADMSNMYDFTVNFGAAGPGSFKFDPVAILTAAMQDATGLKKGWGVHAQ